MQNQPDVSVIIPIYNKRRHIRRAVESVLAQTHSNFELILVDDGSTDGSLEALKSLDDPRVRRMQRPNGGVSRARNTGIAVARSDLIAFLDADDVWSEDFLHAMFSLRAQFPQAGLYASGYNIKVGNAPSKRAKIRGLPLFRRRFQTHRYFQISATGELPITASSVMIPRQSLLRIGGFPRGVNMGEDQHVWWQLCTHQPFAYDRRPLATYHRDSDNRLCNHNLPSAELPFSKHLRAALPTLGLSHWQTVQAERYIGGHILHLVRENIRAGRLDIAQQLLKDPKARRLPIKWLFRRIQLLRSQRPIRCGS